MRASELLIYGGTPDGQPELWRFISDIADRVGAAMPERVELLPLPDVKAAGGRLVIGLPQAIGLDADELAEVIASELVCERTREDWVVARHRPGAAGPELVATALLHSAHLAVAFERFVIRHVGPLSAAGYYPADLWDGWRSLTPRAPGARPVPLRPLGLEAEAGFARLLAEEFARRQGGLRGESRLRPVTFDEVPQEVWDASLARQAAAVRAAAALLLRRHRAGSRDVLELVVRDGKAAELLRYAGAESPDLDPTVRTLAPLVHEVLRRRHYTFEHPLRQHLYVGQAWDRIDVGELLTTLDQPNSQARLHYLLA